VNRAEGPYNDGIIRNCLPEPFRSVHPARGSLRRWAPRQRPWSAGASAPALAKAAASRPHSKVNRAEGPYDDGIIRNCLPEPFRSVHPTPDSLWQWAPHQRPWSAGASAPAFVKAAASRRHSKVNRAEGPYNDGIIRNCLPEPFRSVHAAPDSLWRWAPRQRPWSAGASAPALAKAAASRPHSKTCVGLPHGLNNQADQHVDLKTDTAPGLCRGTLDQ